MVKWLKDKQSAKHSVHLRKPDNSDLTREEFSELIRLCKKVLWAGPETHREIQRHRINIIPANFYSDIPLIEEIENSFENDAPPEGPFASLNIFNPNLISEYLETLSPHAKEFDPPVEGNRENPRGYFWKAPSFSYSDAMAYYCIIRHTKPRRIIEIGSGFSSLIALEALEKNGTGELVCIEPFPLPWMDRQAERFGLIRKRIQEITPAYFNEILSDGDILFIDSTHTVKAGSDCLYIYLKILPELDCDLYIHAHDIHLPYQFSKKMMFEKRVFWTEQYLLYAYLLENPRTRVLYGSALCKQWFPDQLDRFMKGRYPSGGGSFWFRQSSKCGSQARKQER